LSIEKLKHHVSNGLLTSFRPLDSSALAVEHGVSMLKAGLRTDDVNALGPIFELAVLAHSSAAWSSCAKTITPPSLIKQLRSARREKLRTFTSNTDGVQLGFMCLKTINADAFRPALLEYDTVARRAMRFRRDVGKTAGMICGAIGEMLDNIFEHSQLPDTGMVGFLGTADYLDVCVADAGIGVLTSLKMNPAYAYLPDAGAALALAIKDGTSRYPTSAGGEGRGHGFSTLFRGLNTLDAEVRLRSGNYALEIEGKGMRSRSPSISEKAHLQGFVVSFRVHL
jgi:hypothetical protein